MTHPPLPSTHKDLPVLFFGDQASWRDWLLAHHTQPTGIWLAFAKKASGITSLAYGGALDEALCFGWIDGQVNTLDETYYLQRFTPRTARSSWSKRNVGKVAQLIAAGKMQPAGQAAIDSAKADGRWERAYDSPTTITMPDDFAQALQANSAAKATYDGLSKSSVYMILLHIQTAKKAETRQARIERFIAKLADGQRQF